MVAGALMYRAHLQSNLFFFCFVTVSFEQIETFDHSFPGALRTRRSKKNDAPRVPSQELLNDVATWS